VLTHKFKLVALGAGRVGKTSCIKRFTDRTFSETYKATIGTTIAMKTVDVDLPNGEHISADIVFWDLAGQTRFSMLRRRYMAGASMAFIVYDVTRPGTFIEVTEWYDRFIAVCPDAVVAVVANKIDRKDRFVPPEAGKMVQKMWNAMYYETSAKTGDNVELMFKDLVRRAIKADNLKT
jgi:small GTP-binding protein